MYHTSSKHVRDVSQICPTYILEISKKCLRNVPCLKMSQKCPRHVPDMAQIRVRHIQDMSKIYPRYIPDIREITRNFPDRSQIFLWFVPDMSQIFHRTVVDKTKVCPRYVPDKCPRNFPEMSQAGPRNKEFRGAKKNFSWFKGVLDTNIYIRFMIIYINDKKQRCS